MNWKRYFLLLLITTLAGVTEDCLAVLVVTGKLQFTWVQLGIILCISVALSSLLEVFLHRFYLRSSRSR